jgi:hypothetical protein
LSTNARTPASASARPRAGPSISTVARLLRVFEQQVPVRPGAALGDLLDSAGALARRRDVDHEVLVAFRSVPDHQRLAEHLPEWRTATEAAAWFAANNVLKPPRQYGAFLFTISAKDPTAAARVAGKLVQRLQARACFARGESGSRLDPVGRLWIAGHIALPVAAPARAVDVLSLVRRRRCTPFPVTT